MNTISAQGATIPILRFSMLSTREADVERVKGQLIKPSGLVLSWD
jgi:hypothetical protein